MSTLSSRTVPEICLSDSLQIVLTKEKIGVGEDNNKLVIGEDVCLLCFRHLEIFLTLYSVFFFFFCNHRLVNGIVRQLIVYNYKIMHHYNHSQSINCFFQIVDSSRPVPTLNVHISVVLFHLCTLVLR